MPEVRALEEAWDCWKVSEGSPSPSRDSEILKFLPEDFGLHVAHSYGCRKEGFLQHTPQHSSLYSPWSYNGRNPTLHRVSAFYLDNISPGNVKTMSFIISNDIYFKCSFLFSFSMKNRVLLIVWRKGCVISGVEQYKYVRKVKERCCCTQQTWGLERLPSLSPSPLFNVCIHYIISSSP